MIRVVVPPHLARGRAEMFGTVLRRRRVYEPIYGNLEGLRYVGGLACRDYVFVQLDLTGALIEVPFDELELISY